MIKKIFTILFIVLSNGLFSQEEQRKLSMNSKISILTIGPGDYLYDKFGHSAIRVKDYTKDIVFNYGSYNFNEPNFYLKFAEGKLNYKLDVKHYQNFYNSYVQQNRSINEQILNLTWDEREAFFTYLITNAQPEHRDYLYDFFYDNCATKIRDVLQESVNAKIAFNYPKNLKSKSFRTLINSHLNNNSWGSLGIDLALGSIIDKKAAPYEYMFLPNYIQDFFKLATLNNKPLVLKENQLFKPKETKKSSWLSSFVLSPLFVFSVLGLFILWITYKDYTSNTRTNWLDFILFLITGFIGIILCSLWFATNHTATAFNYNLLWAFPLNSIVAFQLAKNTPKSWILKYIKLLLILLCLLSLHWIIGVQIFAIGLLPLLIALGVRYVFLVWKLASVK